MRCSPPSPHASVVMGILGWKQMRTATPKEESQSQTERVVCVCECVSLVYEWLTNLWEQMPLSRVRERNRKAVMQATGDSHHLDVEGEVVGWELAFLGRLLMNLQGDDLLHMSFCNSLIALKLNGILQSRNSFFGLWRILLLWTLD